MLYKIIFGFVVMEALLLIVVCVRGVEQKGKKNMKNSITGAWNRYAFMKQMKYSFKKGNAFAVIVKFSDLKYYNTTLGVHSVNRIRKKAAEWLDAAWKEMQCYDCGNGVFALVGFGIEGSKEKEIEGKIMERFQDAWKCIKTEIVIPVQVCSVHIPDDVHTMEDMLLVVDREFSGKESEILNFQDMLTEYQRKIMVEAAIYKALENKSFEVYYQPIWDRENGNIHSAEALIRLKDEELGFISPEEFIPIAERNGTIFDIGLFVFEEACRFYKEKNLQAQGIDYIEVNLSVIQCMDSNLVQNFNEILSQKDLEACHINLEITESAVTDNQGILKRTVRALDHMGIRFSLDDYGTGYSNISFMYDMPFTIIKIDKSILWKALHPQLGQGDYRARIMLEKTVSMLQEMKYQILVEGVETEEQKNLLEKMQCDYLQGYFFSKPLPADEFMDYLQAANT
ncbi:MAG: EAL domain-containing protein [Lachnospiraceae bacterium]|nr:EAL domain-containing protein [Lachnospiraceae bacterium]